MLVVNLSELLGRSVLLAIGARTLVVTLWAARGFPVGEALREALKEGRRLKLGEVRQKWGDAAIKALGIRNGEPQTGNQVNLTVRDGEQ